MEISVVVTLLVCLEESAFIIGRGSRYRVNFGLVFISYLRECEDYTLIVLWKCVSWNVLMPSFPVLYSISFYWVAVTTAWRVFLLRMEETAFGHGRWVRIYWIHSYGHPTKGNPSALCLGEGLIISQRKMSTCFEMLQRPWTWTHALG
jgi:hypothetical protein